MPTNDELRRLARQAREAQHRLARIEQKLAETRTERDTFVAALAGAGIADHRIAHITGLHVTAVTDIRVRTSVLYGAPLPAMRGKDEGRRATPPAVHITTE